MRVYESAPLTSKPSFHLERNIVAIVDDKPWVRLNNYTTMCLGISNNDIVGPTRSEVIRVKPRSADTCPLKVVLALSNQFLPWSALIGTRIATAIHGR